MLVRRVDRVQSLAMGALMQAAGAGVVALQRCLFVPLRPGYPKVDSACSTALCGMPFVVVLLMSVVLLLVLVMCIVPVLPGDDVVVCYPSFFSGCDTILSSDYWW